MDISAYQRIKFNKYGRDFLMGNVCERCGVSNNLELHHEEQFVKMLDKTLKSLNLEYKKDKNEYTKQELECITNMMLGMQLKSKYATLCTKCHDDYHRSNKMLYIFTKKEKNKEKELDSNVLNELEDFLQSSLIVRGLYSKKDFIQIIQSIILKDNNLKLLLNKMGTSGSRPKGQKLYNRLFEQLFEKGLIGSKFIVSSQPKWKTIDKKRVKETYWVITKEEN